MRVNQEIETVQGKETASAAQLARSCRGSVFEIKERAGANPRGLATSTLRPTPVGERRSRARTGSRLRGSLRSSDAEIGHDGRQELVEFMNCSG